MGLGRALGSAGMWLGKNTVNSYAAPYRGGFTPSIIGAAVGTGAGAMLSSKAEESGLVGAGIGAVAGGLALPILGAVGALGVKGAMAAYKNPVRALGGLGGAASLGGIGAAVGAVGGPVGSIIGGATGAIGGAVGGVIKPGVVGKAMAGTAGVAGKSAAFLGKGAAGSALRYANAGLGLAGSVLKYTPEHTYFDEGKNKLVTKRGKMGIRWGGAAVAGVIGGLVAGPKLIDRGLDEIADMRKGQNAGVQRATPSYLDNAGATGDLVFAMHQNRRG